MSTKIRVCKNCGWEFPATYTSCRCKFCRGPMLNGYCSICGKWTDKLLKHTLCRDCARKNYAAWRQGRYDAAQAKYDDWLDKIKQIPTPYKTLTEREWMEACRHFGGCAYCGSESIDSRSMFIDFADGGRYCAWNIIPACEKCETVIKIHNNPFKRCDDVLNVAKAALAKKYGYSLEKLQRITDYLQSKMEDTK